MQPRNALLSLAALLAGCASAPEVRPLAAPAPAQPTVEMVQGAQLARYALALQSVVQGSPTEKAEVMNRARADFENAKRGPAALLYALLLSAPNHSDRDTTQARRLLTEAMAYPELLTMAERALAAVELARVNEELSLKTENERLVTEAQAQAERERQRNAPTIPALQRRLQAEIDENARLRKQLDEAKAKLDAIAELEKRLSERQPATEGRKP